LDDKCFILEFIKLSLFECNPARQSPIIFRYVAFAFREKHGLVRNDFLDCLMELRQAGKNEGQGGVQYAENANTGDMISKLKQHFIL